MSAIVLALGLTGAGATPFIVHSASASTVSYDPPVEPCDAGDPNCEQVTVTATVTAPTPTPEEVPETTVTTTVTAAPTRTTRRASPTRSASSSPARSSQPQNPPPTTEQQNPVPPPSQNVEVPAATPPTVASTPQETPLFPSVAPTDTAATALPSDTAPPSSEEVPLELRNAAPEFDQRTLTQQLSIPALVLVLLALFAVLIFEGRLRRMAHAAAVRKAGPQLGRPDLPPGYPAGPGYAAAGFPGPAGPAYPGGTAYAPIISFVPVQAYPSGPVQYGGAYPEPGHPYPPQGYAQQPTAPPEPPPVVLHPDDFASYPHEPQPPARAAKEYRDPFEPAVPPVDIPEGGSGAYEDGRDHPFGPASSAEQGDPDPWKDGGALFRPADRQSPADDEMTLVEPLPPEPEPGKGPTKEMPDSERERFRRDNA